MNNQVKGRSVKKAICLILTLSFAFISFALFAPLPIKADEPGRGLTAQFEIEYLKFIIDHHFAALRMTELAAGTDPIRNASISPNEGTAPSPNFSHTQAKATLDEIKNIARHNNRMQREEILTAQKFLREWYNINYQPRISQMSQRQIEILEHASTGTEFNHLFLEIFSRRHFIATQRSVECLVASELRHKDLERYCRGIVNGQLNDIDEMRNLLCDRLQVCDYQPLSGLKGRHSGDEPDDH